MLKSKYILSIISGIVGIKTNTKQIPWTMNERMHSHDWPWKLSIFEGPIIELAKEKPTIEITN